MVLQPDWAAIYVPRGQGSATLLTRGWCKTWTLDSGLDSWTGLWTEIWTRFWTDAQGDDDHFQETMDHRLQLSLNLRDSPGFLATVPRPGRLCYNCIIGPGRGPDTGINTVVVVQLVTYLWQNEQAACGSALQTLVFAVATLQEVY